MSLATILQRKAQIQAIVSVFETGTPAGDPRAVALLDDGAGVSYGIHQATAHSRSLWAVLDRYAVLGGAYAADLEAVRPVLAASPHANPRRPGEDLVRAMAVLDRAGTDPLMRRAQEEVFDELYWVPALEQCAELELVLPLSAAVVYDTRIQSGPRGLATIRRRFPEVPPASGGAERAWARAYVVARRSWLASSTREVVRRTVYRMDALEDLMQSDAWMLEPPFRVRGQVVR